MIVRADAVKINAGRSILGVPIHAVISGRQVSIDKRFDLPPQDIVYIQRDPRPAREVESYHRPRVERVRVVLQQRKFARKVFLILDGCYDALQTVGSPDIVAEIPPPPEISSSAFPAPIWARD